MSSYVFMFSLTDTQNIHNPNKIAINLSRNMYLCLILIFIKTPYNRPLCVHYILPRGRTGHYFVAVPLYKAAIWLGLVKWNAAEIASKDFTFEKIFVYYDPETGYHHCLGSTLRIDLTPNCWGKSDLVAS